jgi:Zn-dependent protease
MLSIVESARTGGAAVGSIDMQGRGWRIGRIGGVDVRVDPSWAIIALLLTSYLWSLYSEPGRFPDLATAAAIGLSLLTAALFFLSILGHELAHAGMSKLRAIPVDGITLYMFGGATHTTAEARGPSDEFLITVVGPVTSAIIGVAFLFLHSLGSSASPAPFDVMFQYLGRTNILLALFNLLPGFPLDGGRVLRSGIWLVTGSLATATSISARIGQALGAVMIAVGVIFGLSRQDYGILWLGLIGWILLQAATGAISEGKRRRLLEQTTASEVMSPPPPTVPAGLAVSDVLTTYLEGHDGEAFPVVENGSVIGFVSLGTARGVALDRPVQDAMVRPDATVLAGPDESMAVVATRLGDGHGSVVLVVADGRLVGVIEPEDLNRFFARGRR